MLARKNREGKEEWPHLINTTFGKLMRHSSLDMRANTPLVTAEMTKTGELALLRFPNFKDELLYEDHWNAGDDTGRIKVVISEVFPRDSLTMPVERVKNLVVFSFQHAPLGMSFQPRLTILSRDIPPAG